MWIYSYLERLRQCEAHIVQLQREFKEVERQLKMAEKTSAENRAAIEAVKAQMDKNIDEIKADIDGLKNGVKVGMTQEDVDAIVVGLSAVSDRLAGLNAETPPVTPVPPIETARAMSGVGGSRR